jgi:hypothetical protein
MTGRQRLLNALSGKDTDRICVSPWIYNNFIFEHFGHEPKSMDDFYFGNGFDIDKNTIRVYEHYGFDLINRLGSVWDIYREKSAKNWEVKVEFLDKGRIQSEITTIRTPKKTLRQVKDIKQISKYTFVEAIIEYFIKDKDDFENFANYQPLFNIDCSRIFRARELTGDNGVVFACMHGAFNTLNMYRRLDDMMMDPLLDEGFYRSMLHHFTSRSKAMIKESLKHGADVFNMAINMATATAVGVDYFNRFILEYETELMDEIHIGGALVCSHNCGDGMGLIDTYNKMPIDAYETMTPPPFGDMDFDMALEKFDRRICLMGNIDQVEFMMKAEPGQVYQRVKEIIIKAKQRGNFILTTSDWLFDGTPKDNVRAFVEAGLEYGSYD